MFKTIFSSALSFFLRVFFARDRKLNDLTLMVPIFLLLLIYYIISTIQTDPPPYIVCSNTFNLVTNDQRFLSIFLEGKKVAIKMTTLRIFEGKTNSKKGQSYFKTGIL